MFNAAASFAYVRDVLIGVAARTITVTTPDGTVKYTCKATSGIAPRASGLVNSYDQTRIQYTHDANAGTPEKFDLIVIDGAPRAIEEVRPQWVGDVILTYRIIVKG